MGDSVTDKKVLIVEDDMIISMVLERMIKKLGHEVVKKVIAGQDAIDSAFELEPDLILMDIQLKDNIDGITAMQKIREKSDVLVIYITGNSDQYSLERAKKTDYVDYLVKPIQMSHLKKSISKAFAEQIS
ncbi:response regulator [Aliifodinibius salipaludis]|uniref:Response regulator n=1 Tax=Fodinibius salipaludis TaxID=2032627 RepID=A0A2A2G9K0_9BACT|nr:response regulator [Aliifodinibius salipaludis]PAU93492.1 response regulator [Aliifodinibius salipaludis]